MTDGLPKSNGRLSILLGLLPLVLLGWVLSIAPYSLAQSTMAVDASGSLPSQLMKVPVSRLFPGNVKPGETVSNPTAGDKEAVQRGMQYFKQMNCVGCHAPNGAGGMGPALSNREFIYGSEPENIFLSILQGRPNGMPAWGGMLPDSVIWDLVSYVKSISQAPQREWGKTTSADSFKIEQVPAENIQTAKPWDHTERFGFGQAPNQKVAPTPDQSPTPVK